VAVQLSSVDSSAQQLMTSGTHLSSPLPYTFPAFFPYARARRAGFSAVTGAHQISEMRRCRAGITAAADVASALLDSAAEHFSSCSNSRR